MARQHGLGLQHLDRGVDRTASGVPQHHDEWRAQELNAVFERRQQVRRHDVAGDAHDEEIARPLVESQLWCHARIRTTEDRGDRILHFRASGASGRESRSLGVFAA